MTAKRSISVVLVLLILISTSGCSGEWRKKFVRRKKDVAENNPVLQPQDYRKEFTSRQLYANHYAFWQNAETELLRSVEERKSSKRLRSQSSYAEVELKKLSDMLIAEKQQEILPYVDELKAIVADINKPNYISSNRNLIAERLRKHYRQVARNFSYFAMKNYVREDEEKSGDGN